MPAWTGRYKGIQNVKKSFNLQNSTVRRRLRILKSCKHKLLSWNRKDESEGRTKNLESGVESHEQGFLGKNGTESRDIQYLFVQFQSYR